MKRLLIIGAGEMQVPIIKKAKQLGHYCIVSDINPEAPGFNFADKSVISSTFDKEKTLECAIANKIDGVLTTSDYPVRTVAYICEKLNLKGISTYSAKICTDKYKQRQAMLGYNFYNPKHFLISTDDDLTQIINNLEYPLIVKPIDSSASRGVTKVANKEELLNAINYAKQYSLHQKVIIEEFIDGLEYSVECITQDRNIHIIAITQKDTKGANNKYFVENKHIVPANISYNLENKIHKYVKQIIKIFKIDNSAIHAEIKISSKGIVLIELGARLGGDFITSDLIPLATGIDMLENAIRIALNEQVNITQTKSLYAGIKFVNTENYNNARDHITKNTDSIFKYELKPYKNVSLTNSLDRLGFIISCCENRKDLEKILNF